MKQDFHSTIKIRYCNMTKERFQQIKEEVKHQHLLAQRVLNGDSEYDGADAARHIRDLCFDFRELIAFAEQFIIH